jgi:hypothetical protein
LKEGDKKDEVVFKLVNTDKVCVLMWCKGRALW